MLQPCSHAVQQQAPAHLQARQRNLYLKTPCRQQRWPIRAQNGESAQKEGMQPRAPATGPAKTSHEQRDSPPQQQQQQQQQQQERWGSILVWLQERWQPLDLPQKAYTVVLGLVLLAALPKVLTVLVLLLDRVLLGGLLALEEVLLQLVLKGGALLAAVGAAALLGAGLYIFARKPIK